MKTMSTSTESRGTGIGGSLNAVVLSFDERPDGKLSQASTPQQISDKHQILMSGLSRMLRGETKARQNDGREGIIFIGRGRESMPPFKAGQFEINRSLSCWLSDSSQFFA